MSVSGPSRRRRVRRLVAILAALAASFAVPVLAGPAGPAQAAARPAPTALPANLESIRASEATALYGDPAIRDLDARKTALITMGDSEISGEGEGNYVPGTHQTGDYCDRSYDQAVFRVTIPSDIKYNIACSGATPHDITYGAGPPQYNELNQGDNLAIKARNTHIKLIWIAIGANGTGNIAFGPVATDCVERRILFQGPCWPSYTDDWNNRVAHTQAEVEAAINSTKQTMANAGYLPGDYRIVMQSYGGPMSPDVEDNPNFPGWYSGGCEIYLADMAFARNKAVPLFEGAERRAAADTGVGYLDFSRLFHGHEPCTDNTWVRGVYLELGVFTSDAARQSLHPNSRGHGAFASCMSQYWDSGIQVGSCVDPASTGNPVLVPGLLEFKQFRNTGSSLCVDGSGYNSRNKTALQAYTCHGGRNQGFWYDSGYKSLHVELSHDRCVDVPNSSFVVGAKLQLYDCNGSAAQQWIVDGAALHPAANTGLCAAFAGTAAGSRLQLAACNAADARQSFSFESRNFANPVGYNHDDFIGSRVY